MPPSFKSTPFLRFPSESPRAWRGWRVAILITGLLAPPAAAQTTAFTYQGRLTDGGAPAAGLHDFEFELHADNGGDAQVGETVSVEDVNVTGGLFTPVAQDFHAAFGLNGDDDQHIATVDADGVALAAIQGLNEKVVDLGGKADRRLRTLEAENAELKARLERLERLLAASHAK